MVKESLKFNRSSNVNQIIIKEKGQILTLNMTNFFKEHHLDRAIRITKFDYRYLHPDLKYLTHFNLQYTNHKKGHVYALPLILAGFNSP